jgi:hypothetical protein
MFRVYLHSIQGQVIVVSPHIQFGLGFIVLFVIKAMLVRFVFCRMIVVVLVSHVVAQTHSGCLSPFQMKYEEFKHENYILKNLSWRHLMLDDNFDREKRSPGSTTGYRYGLAFNFSSDWLTSWMAAIMRCYWQTVITLE